MRSGTKHQAAWCHFPPTGRRRPTLTGLSHRDLWCYPASFMVGMLRFGMANPKESAAMKCLRIYATPDGKSQFRKFATWSDVFDWKVMGSRGFCPLAGLGEVAKGSSRTLRRWNGIGWRAQPHFLPSNRIPALRHRVARHQHIVHLGILRLLRPAALVGQRAARMEGAAGRRVDRARHLAAHGRAGLPVISRSGIASSSMRV